MIFLNKILFNFILKYVVNSIVKKPKIHSIKIKGTLLEYLFVIQYSN